MEQSPSGAWFVRAEGAEAPVARFDSEDEAHAKALAITRGLAREAASPPEGETVPLRDGSVVLVRQVRPEDKPLFEAGIRRLGPQGRRQRFLWAHPPSLSEAELRLFTELDHRDHEAIGAIDVATGEGVGVARYIRESGGSPNAEAAVTIVDDWQGRGLGTVLAERLAARAEAAGITHLVATLYATNRAMAHVFAHLGELRESSIEAGCVELDITLEVGELRQRVKDVAEAHEAARQATQH